MPEGPGGPATVLVVDADGARAGRVRAALGRAVGAPFQVETADDLAGGLTRLDAGGVDLVLFALDLPDGTGPETVGALRARVPDVPVVAIVASDDDRGADAALAAGAQDFVTDADLDGEVLRRTVRYVLERQRLQNELHRRTVVDELTGLYNPKGFEQLASHHLRLSDRTGQPVVLLFVRLEGMRDVSETHGATAGPRLVADTADVLRAAVREVDVVARLGTDTFCVLLTGDATGAEDQVLTRLVEAVATHNARSGVPHLALSVGTAAYDPHDPTDLPNLIREADGRMRAQRRPGG